MPIQLVAFHAFEPYERHRSRNLRYDINALADFEQLTGMGFGQLMSMKAMFATCRALLYAGLKHEDRTLTVERVGDLVMEFINDEKNGDNGNIDYLVEKALEAAVDQGALGRKAKEQKATQDAAKNAKPLALVEPPAESTSPVIDVPVGG